MGLPKTTARAILGLILLLTGVLALGALITLTNCLSDACEKLTFRLGLAGMALASCGAQILVLLGGWMLWRATRPIEPT